MRPQLHLKGKRQRRKGRVQQIRRIGRVQQCFPVSVSILQYTHHSIISFAEIYNRIFLLVFFFLGKVIAKGADDVCPICLNGFHDPVTTKCNHKFCRKCIDLALQHRKVCPTCGMTYGMQTGNMPPGTMNQYLEHYSHIPGYERYGTIRIDYYFPSGTQGPEHPNPGQRYTGTSRTAFLPDCPEGREVLDLLKKAFNARLTFTIGRSVTTGASNVVIWNDINHKTSTHGGATG